MKPDITISIWSNTRELLDQCVASIKEKTKGVSYEILANIFKFGDTWFSKVHNEHIRKAKGKYVCILNDDTILYNDALSIMYRYMDYHPKCGIVGAKLLNSDLSHQDNRSRFPTRLWVLFERFWINYLFPNNPINTRATYRGVAPDMPMVVDCTGGACMMIRRGYMYDENFRLYYEDVDLCRQVYDMGEYVYYLPTAQVIHLGNQTGRKLKDRERIFKESRRYYFKK